MATVPDLNDKDLLTFVQRIADDATIWVEWSGLPAIPPGTLSIELVPPMELDAAEPNRCWFNCRDAQHSLPKSEIVYGWHVYALHWKNQETGVWYVSYAAGHHAVIRHQGKLFDVTPQVGARGELLREQTVFVADARIPFDFKENRTVLAAHWSPTHNRFLWSTDIMDPEAAEISEDFGIIWLGSEG